MTRIRWLLTLALKLAAFLLFQGLVHAVAFYFMSPEVSSDYFMQIFYDPPK